jgi:hypothetical protein
VQGRLFFIPRPPHRNLFISLFGGADAPASSAARDDQTGFVVLAQP